MERRKLSTVSKGHDRRGDCDTSKLAIARQKREEKRFAAFQNHAREFRTRRLGAATHVVSFATRILHAGEDRAKSDHVEANHLVRLASQWIIGDPRKSVLARSLGSRYDRCRFFPFSPALAIEE